jgi:hypothetical protein
MPSLTSARKRRDHGPLVSLTTRRLGAFEKGLSDLSKSNVYTFEFRLTIGAMLHVESLLGECIDRPVAACRTTNAPEAHCKTEHRLGLWALERSRSAEWYAICVIDITRSPTNLEVESIQTRRLVLHLTVRPN